MISTRSINQVIPSDDIRDLYTDNGVATRRALPYSLPEEYSGSISGIIHLIWLGENIPLFVQTNIIHWAECNPEYQVWVWVGFNRQSCVDLKKSFQFDNLHFIDCRNWLYEIKNNDDIWRDGTHEQFIMLESLFARLRQHVFTRPTTTLNLAMLSDILRIVFLFMYGGVYFDVNDCYFNNQGSGKEPFIKKLPPSHYFYLPLGFMMRIGCCVGDAQERQAWPGRVKQFYAQHNSNPVNAEIVFNQIPATNDFLLAVAKNHFLYCMIYRILNHYDNILKVIVHKNGRSTFNQTIQLTGPGLLRNHLPRYLQWFTNIDAKHFIYYYSPLKFSEFYFPAAMPNHGTWYGQGFLDILEDKTIQYGKKILRHYRSRKCEQKHL